MLRLLKTYMGVGMLHFSSDVNECFEQTDNCDTFAQCINLENGGFECRCLEGYEGNGRQCSGTMTSSR